MHDGVNSHRCVCSEENTYWSGILNGQTYQPAVKMALVKIWQVLIVEIQLMMQLMMQLVDYKKMMVIRKMVPFLRYL